MTSAAPHRPSLREHACLVVLALAALAPFLLHLRQFGQLFWFGDEWDLLDQIDRVGMWQWSYQMFAENFVPVFKLLWAGAVHLGGGSYLFMLTLMWLTHALNVYLAGRLLRAAGAGSVTTLAVQMLFGLPPANWETLAWSVQWSAMLSTLFLLVGALVLMPALRSPGHPLPWPRTIAVLACALASAWAFSRGVLTGGLFALAWGAVMGRAAPRRIWGPAAVWLAPSLLTALLIATFAGGNHHRMSGHLLDAATYALGNFLLNPFHALLEIDSYGPTTTALLAVIKLALLGWGLGRASGALRLLLVLALIFDLGNAALLGLGRYHTGIETAVSSRYQYGSLLATAPFLGFWLEHLVTRSAHPAVRRPLQVAVLAGLLLVARGWSVQLAVVVPGRGLALREALQAAPADQRFEVGAIPSMTLQRAREIAAEFELH